MFKKYLVLILFFFSILLLSNIFPRQSFAASTIVEGSCVQAQNFTDNCPGQDTSLVRNQYSCSGGCDPPGKGSIFQCRPSGINFYPPYCCVSASDDKSGEDIAFENQLDCARYYKEEYNKGCRDNGKRYANGSTYCKDNTVMTCNNGVTKPTTNCSDTNRRQPQSVSMSENATTQVQSQLKQVCYEKYNAKEKKSEAKCLIDDEFGKTCGDPSAGLFRCCCVNEEIITTGISEGDQFGINRYINQASEMVLGQINKDGDNFKNMNRIQSACVSGYEPIYKIKSIYKDEIKEVKLFNVFGSDEKINEGKIDPNLLSDNAIKVCDENCICVADADQTDPNSLCNRYYNIKKYLNGKEDPKGKENPEDPQVIEREQCRTCLNPGRDDDNKIVTSGYWSALGCIKLSSWGDFFQQNVFPIIIGLGGMFALLCIILSAIQIQTSAGNAEKIKKAQQMMTSCIIGLIMIIFSIFILRLIGFTILKIPGFQ